MIRRYSETQIVSTVERLTVTQLRTFVATECLSPQEDNGQLTFTEADIARVELLLDLTDGYDMDDDALALVMRLVDQLHGLRRELKALSLAIEDQHEDARTNLRDAFARHRTG